MYTVADLFCGCGGFSQGFLRSGRFDVVLGNDIKAAALRTFAFNHATERGAPSIISGDIRQIPTSEFVTKLDKKGIHQGDLDCLIGGPPCQGFSTMRRSEGRKDSEIVKFKAYNRLHQDPRNDLVLRFLEIATELRPKFILIENVPQMKFHAHNGERGGLVKIIIELLNNIGYEVNGTILNAADFGVPQLRKRLLFIASRVSSVSFPTPTHRDPENHGTLWERPWVTVAEAISDLPPPAPGPLDDLGGGPLERYPQVEFSEFARLMRSNRLFPYNHITRTYSAKITRTIQEMQQGETWDHAISRMQEQYERLITEQKKSRENREHARERLIKQGLIEPTFYHSYYWSSYTRLALDHPALTITANANFLGSGRFTHPTAHRGITMREAARLQSFRDDFRFITDPDNDDVTYKIGIGLDMIGEAVPPLLAEAIARHLASLLDRQTSEPIAEAAREIARPAEV